MKKKLLIILLILLGLLLIRIFTYPPNKKTNLYQELMSTRLLCELSIGSKSFDDYFQSNRSLCYSGKAAKGDFLACYQTHNPSECLVSVSLNTKTILCDKLDQSLQDKCLKQLFDYYSERAINFERVQEVSKSEVIKLENKERFDLITDEVVVNVNGSLMKENRRCISSGGKLNCTVEGYSLFSCTQNGLPIKLTGKGANHKLGEPIMFINSCQTLLDDRLEIHILSFQ